MSTQVQRFIVTAHPMDRHPKFYRWQTGTLCIFVSEDDRVLALEKAKREMARRRWIPIEFTQMDALVEERVREAGGRVWNAYQQAKNDGIFFMESTDPRIGEKETLPPPPAPRLTEAFIDTVIERADGHRLTAKETNNAQTRNADYLVDNYVFELKTLEEEGLEKENRQARLGKLFSKVRTQRKFVPLEPSLLNRTQQLEYMDIVGGPIKTHIRSASDQIKKTKAHLADTNLRGGVICLNTGYGSLPPQVFERLVERYAKKDSKQIDAVVCISAWCMTNGFDTNINFKFYPQKSDDPTIEKIGKAFMARINEWMTDFVRSGCIPEAPADPLKPIAFEREGIILSFVPPQLPDSRFEKK